ncbi:MAG: A24 family peptidase [Gemmatimonadetes bacterium]|nr:A24 family peptidase [Gemmatimonadota bacterium]MCY3612903.1 A24 family peptidase [Gemmatimonadota bacterium]MCY3677047.1 A24 family peptidase [Gemmatimonadota bacterium]MYA40426.1 prepilin peptidase [Gemmatimonadota bacterium]MYE94827.1 prepilin peptidase [Gemmatimonadota bacterium]
MNGLLPVGVAAVVGACVGSFLTVCVARWPEGRSVVSPRSRCLNCKSRLAWWENVPVLGFLLVRGRCRRCGERLSAMYPVVEVAVALIWAGMTSQWGVHPEAVRGSLFLTLLLGIALTDARQYVIPDEFSVGGCVIGVALAALPGGPSLADAVLGAGLGFGLLWVVAKLGRLVFGKDAMGGGDIKMMAMVGAFLGPAGVLFTLFSGALLGSAIFGPIAFRTARLVPFGIFLAIGAAVAYGWGDPLIAWYLALLGMN